MTEDKRPEPTGLFRRALHRLSADPDELDAEDLQEDTADVGATPVVACAERERVCVYGVLRTVTLRPRAGAPALEAQLYDGSGTVELVWLGRRRIAGIEPGRALVVHGMMTVTAGQRTIFNPVYELRPGPGA